MNAISTRIVNQDPNLISYAQKAIVNASLSQASTRVTIERTKNIVERLPALTGVAPENEDVNIVEGIFHGIPEFEEQFIRKYRQKLNVMLIRMTHDPSRAEDLTHDSLMLVLQKLRTQGINEPCKLAGYVFSTARYVYLAWLRRKDNQVELRDGMDDVISEGCEPEQACIFSEDIINLQRSIKNLSVGRDREILSRRYLQDQTKDEICDAMYFSTDHYNRVISRARFRLKKEYQVPSAMQGS